MMVAKYKCECGYKWKSKNSSGGTKSCNMCYKDVQPYKYRPAKAKVYCVSLSSVCAGFNYSLFNDTGVEKGAQADVWRVSL